MSQLPANLPDFKYRGARAAVALHAEELRRFLEVWRRAQASGLDLPEVKDPDYRSLEALLCHVFRWAGRYLTWSCEQLELPDPGIEPVPGPDLIEARADDYLECLLRTWVDPLRDLPLPVFIKETYAAPWGTCYCIDAMLEHAVMHPVKHRFQLDELMGER